MNDSGASAEHGSESRVILASAGTGKTYQLTSQYLRVMTGAHPGTGADPESILATTFTRKASGEIFDRLARRLLGACAQGERGEKALEELRRGVHPALDRDRCVELLAAIASKLHRLHIRTIDSFFVMAAGAYELELDLAPGWRLVEDYEDALLRLEAIERVLEAGDRDELVALIRLLSGGAFARSVQRALHNAIETAYPLYVQSKDGPRSEPGACPNAWRVAKPDARPLEGADLEAATAALRAVSLPLTRSETPHKTWQKAHRKAGECVDAEDWDGFLNTGIAKKIIEGETKFSGVEIDASTDAAYGTLVRHAQSVLLDELDRRNIATFALLQAFDREYWAIKRARGAYLFDDIPRMLLERRTTHGLDDLYYRIDGRIAHLLLDEFQDTSIMQFRLLEPLIDEMLADPSTGRSVFCVGDLKQSLYGWRDAEPELLEKLPQRWAQFGPAQTLERSFRSSPVVLGALNETFLGIAQNRAVSSTRAATSWGGRFRAHEPAPHLAPLPGQAILRTAPESADPARQARATLEHAAARVADVRRRAPTARIGVLVRRRKVIARLVHALRTLGIDASEEGGNPVTDDPGVAAARSLLWLADHPGDTAAAYHVATSALGPVVGLDDPRNLENRWSVSSELRRRLSRDGYAATLGLILADAAPSLDERGFARFCQLIDLAHHFDETTPTRPAEFVRYMDHRQVEEPGRRPVRVMTVHAAKGLEFDAVILPELDQRWSLRPGDMFVERAETMGPITGVSLYARNALRAMSPRLAEMHETRLARAIEEELCVLYVAMSRAVHHLEMVIAPDDKLSESGSPANVLRHALASSDQAPPDSTLWERRSDADWAEHLNTHARAEAPPRREPIELVLRRPAGVRASRLQRRSPSSMEGGRRLDLADELRLPGAGAALDRGTLLHAWFEAIEWIDDGAPSEARLMEIASALDVGEQTPQAVMPHFQRAIASPAVRQILSRGAYASLLGEGVLLRVRREHPFAVRDTDDDGAPWLLTGVFDRLVTGETASGAAWAQIVDFKSDAIDPDDMFSIGERVAYYRPQMESYARAAARVLRLGPDRVTAKLVFTSCDRVERVV